jgi:ribose 5-phosphate isomerase A
MSLARTFVIAAIKALGASLILRMVAGKTAHSDQGNIFAACEFHVLVDSVRIAAAVSAIPGVLGQGVSKGDPRYTSPSARRDAP